MKTRAVVTSAAGTNRLETVEIDAVGPGELVLELEGCGLCGTDLYKIQQRRNAEKCAGAGSRTEDRELHTPVVLGHELVGSVVAIGPNCSFDEGDRLVVAHHVPCGHCDLCKAGAETNCPSYLENLLVPGGFSERVLIRERAVHNSAFRVPKEIPTESAVLLEPTACVLRGLDKAGLVEGKAEAAVLIFGAGSMGLLHLMVLKATQPSVTVSVIEPNKERQGLATTLGADAVGSRIKGQFDVVFDTVGDAAIVREAQQALKPGGTIVLFAHGADGQMTAVESNSFFRAEQRMLATYSSGRLDQVRAYELLLDPRFDPSPLITHQLSLSDFDRAVELAQNHQALKVLLTP